MLLNRIRFFSLKPKPDQYKINPIKAQDNNIVTRLNEATIKHVLDPLSVLPFEIFTACIKLALPLPERGYTATLLQLTLVSKQWNQTLVYTPTLWSTITVNSCDEDSHATITTSLNLSGDTLISLTICPPIGSDWEQLCGIIIPFTHRIQHITFIADTYSEAIWHPQSDRVIYIDALATVLKSFKNLPSIVSINLGTSFSLPIPTKCRDGAPVPQLLPIWLPQSTVYTRNWKFAPSSLVHIPDYLPNLRELHIDEGIDTLGPILDTFYQMERLYFLQPHTNPHEEDLPKPIWKAITSSYIFPNLTCLQYAQPFSQTILNILSKVAEKLTEVHLRVPYDVVPFLTSTLQAMLQLRTLTLVMTTEGLPRFNWIQSVLNESQINSLRSFSLYHETEQYSKFWKEPSTTHILRVDELVSHLVTLYPKVTRANIDFGCALKWPKVVQLLQSMREIRFLNLNESESSLYEKYNLPFLEELHTRGDNILPMLTAPNLLRLEYGGSSITPLVDFCRNSKQLEAIRTSNCFFYDGREFSKLEPERSPFSLIRDLQIQEDTPMFIHQSATLFLELFPTLTRLSLGGSDFNPGLATFLCLSLLYKPEACPKLEEIVLKGYPEWDVLFLMLEARNLLTGSQWSRISRITLSVIPNHLRSPLTSLLRGEFTARPSNEELSFEGTREIMFDETMYAAFSVPIDS